MTESVYHAVAGQTVALKEIAEVIGRQLGLPVEPGRASISANSPTLQRQTCRPPAPGPAHFSAGSRAARGSSPISISPSTSWADARSLYTGRQEIDLACVNSPYVDVYPVLTVV